MNNQIESRWRTMLFTPLSIFIAFGVGWKFGDLIIGSAIAAICLITLILSRNIWRTANGMNFIVRGTSLNLMPLFAVFLSNITCSFFKSIPYLEWGLLNGNCLPVVYFILMLLTVIAYYLTPASSILSKEGRWVLREISDPNFKQRYLGVIESLKDDIKRIDRETNWSAQYFTPLDAEVEITDKSNKKKKVVKDLLEAIKGSTDRLILVLGDPGAGKSVALRKLCLDLLNSKGVTKEFIIPVYINLKEWVSDRIWSEKSPPSFDEVQEFVLNNLKSRDIVTRNFFDAYYKILYESGNLYFIFDSFDEIPAILGTSHDSLLIDKVSDAFARFLKGARQPLAQGILSSREFRKPTDSFAASTILTIRPMTSAKITRSFETIGQIGENSIKQLFKDRPDLVVYARNPFTAALLANYIKNNDGNFPPNLTDVYEFFIKKTLEVSCKEKLAKYSLSPDEVFNFLISLGSKLLIKSSLEISITEIRATIRVENLDEIIEVLKFSRLCRESHSSERLVSFSHRRFCEFFAVKSLVNRDKLDATMLEDIPLDSLWRDTLVLYCMVAPEKKAENIAKYCWKNLQEIGNLLDNQAVHSLRFLVDAFRGRKSVLRSFKKDLASFVINNIAPQNILASIFAVEALTILDKDKLNEGAALALELNNNLIAEVTLRGCRHLDAITNELERNLIRVFNDSSREGPFWFYSSILQFDKKELIFSLKLSEAFKNVLLAANWIYVRHKIFIVILLIGYTYITKTTLLVLKTAFISIVFEQDSTIFSIFFAFVAISFCIFFYLFYTFVSGLVVEILSLICLFNYKYAYILVEKLLLIITFSLLFAVAFVIYLVKLTQETVSLFVRSYHVEIFGIALLTFTLLIIISKRLRSRFCKMLKVPDFKRNLVLNYLKTYYHNRLCYFQALKSDNSKRVNIYDNFYGTSPYFVSKYLDYLEGNVNKVDGEYPDNTLLKVSSNIHKDRLAKLELKWRGLAK